VAMNLYKGGDFIHFISRDRYNRQGILLGMSNFEVFLQNLAEVILTCCPTKRDSFITESMVSWLLDVASRKSLCITTCESVGPRLNSM